MNIIHIKNNAYFIKMFYINYLKILLYISNNKKKIYIYIYEYTKIYIGGISTYIQPIIQYNKII